MTTPTETCHFTEAEKWLQMAERSYAGKVEREQIDLLLRFAAVHAQLSVAADLDREATAEQRIAECVPAGGSRIQVASAR